MNAIHNMKFKEFFNNCTSHLSYSVNIKQRFNLRVYKYSISQIYFSISTGFCAIIKIFLTSFFHLPLVFTNHRSWFWSLFLREHLSTAITLYILFLVLLGLKYYFAFVYICARNKRFLNYVRVISRAQSNI